MLDVHTISPTLIPSQFYPTPFLIPSSYPLKVSEGKFVCLTLNLQARGPPTVDCSATTFSYMYLQVLPISWGRGYQNWYKFTERSCFITAVKILYQFLYSVYSPRTWKSQASLWIPVFYFIQFVLGWKRILFSYLLNAICEKRRNCMKDIE